MSRETKPARPPIEDAAETFDLTVEEFCAGQSQSDRRVELLAAFYAAELRAGRVKDTADAYAQRYADFANAPA